MPFIGNQPALSYTSFAKQDFTTSATTSYTLDNPVTNENELALFINFVRQEPTTAYTASGTSLTLTSATSASDDMYCVYLGKAVQTVNPPIGSVGTSQLADSAVTSAKLASGVGGKVLQVVSAIDTTKRSTTSTSYVTGSNTLSVNITPASTSNKIIILTSYQTFGSPSLANCFSTVQRTIGATTTDLATNKFAQDYNGHAISVSTAFLDSPNTTAQCTYQVYFRTNNSSYTVYLNAADASNTVDGSIVVMEVAG